jgi:hypothetical protein
VSKVCEYRFRIKISTLINRLVTPDSIIPLAPLCRTEVESPLSESLVPSSYPNHSYPKSIVCPRYLGSMRDWCLQRPLAPFSRPGPGLLIVVTSCYRTRLQGAPACSLKPTTSQSGGPPGTATSLRVEKSTVVGYHSKVPLHSVVKRSPLTEVSSQHLRYRSQ